MLKVESVFLIFAKEQYNFEIFFNVIELALEVHNIFFWLYYEKSTVKFVFDVLSIISILEINCSIICEISINNTSNTI